MANIFNDDFNRANSASLGANWIESVGDVEIASNKVDNTGIGEAIALYVTTITPVDYSVSANLSVLIATNNAGIVGRYSDNNNYYYARILQGSGLQLFSKKSGVLTQLGSTYTFTVDVGTPYLVKLEMTGSDIRVYLNGTLRISTVNTDHTTGNRAGLRINNGIANAGAVDDFSIDDIPGSPSPSASQSPSATPSPSPSASPSPSIPPPIYLAHQFKIYNTNNTDHIHIKIIAQSTLAPSTSPVYLQVWNAHRNQWNTLLTDSTTAAETDIILKAVIDRHQNKYYDSENQVAIRIYQLAN